MHRGYFGLCGSNDFSIANMCLFAYLYVLMACMAVAVLLVEDSSL